MIPFFETHPEVVLDGEFYHHEKDFQTITSIVRRKNHPDLSCLQFHVYDCILPLPYCERYAFIQSIQVDGVVCVETIPASSERIEEFHTLFTSQGYEGIMIRNPSSHYQEQIRSKDLLKYKHFKEDEFEVIGHTEGKRGIPVFICTTQGKTFQVMLKSTMEDKKNSMEQVTSFYHKMLTVKYQELSVDGIPRFPVGIGFRDGI